MDASHLFERSTWARNTLRRALREAEVVTGCSAKTLRDAEEFLGEPLPKARTIFNAANLEDFAKAIPWKHERPYIFALGRVVPQKGFDLLIEAYAEAGLADFDLLIAGDGPERQRLEELIQKFELQQRVHLLGRADRQRSLHFSSAALSLRCLRVQMKVCQSSCAEAMAAGKALIAARAGGTPEAVLDGENGIIFEKEDRLALVAGLKKLAHDPELRERFGMAGAKRSVGVFVALRHRAIPCCLSRRPAVFFECDGRRCRFGDAWS